MTVVKKKKRKKLKVGSRVCWNFQDCRRMKKEKRGAMIGPGKIESINGKMAVFICPSMMGGTYRETVPLKQLVPA